MAGIALIFRYQWRAFWRRFIRTRHSAQFYLTVLAGLGVVFATILPKRLSRAADELAAGQMTSMDPVLWLFCALWLLVLLEDSSVSLTSRHLRTFPIGVGRLLAVRVLSVFCSPVAWLVAAGSLIGLWPFLFARQTVLASAAALLLFALALGIGMSVSHVLGVAELRRKLLAPTAVISIALGALFVTEGVHGIEQLRGASLFMPPHLVIAISLAPTPSATTIPLVTLVAIAVVVWYLLSWSFRRSVFGQPGKPARGRTTESALWFPGRFGGLVRMEQHYVRKLLDVWPGLLLVVAVSVASFFGPLPPIVRQSIIVVVFVFNTHLLMNCFGLNTSAELNRYAILPVRGKDVLLVKNVGLAIVIAAQLVLLILTAVWRSGLLEAGAETLEATVLLLSHLAWGNLASVGSPFKMEFYRFASGGPPLTAMFGSTIGSAPGVLVIVLLQFESPWAGAMIATVLLLVLAIYLASLQYSGRSFERRRHLIVNRLS